MIQEWYRIIPRCGEASMLSRRAIIAARLLHELKEIKNQPAGFEFAHLAERYRPRGCPISTPACWIFRCIEGFVTRGCEPIVPG